jgi:hypothetical protein
MILLEGPAGCLQTTWPGHRHLWLTRATDRLSYNISIIIAHLKYVERTPTNKLLYKNHFLEPVQYRHVDAPPVPALMS